MNPLATVAHVTVDEPGSEIHVAFEEYEGPVVIDNLEVGRHDVRVRFTRASDGRFIGLEVAFAHKLVMDERP